MAVQSTELVVQETGSRSAELVFGSIDGLFSVLGIISAAGSAALIPVQIFATGVGGAVAGALSTFGKDQSESARLRDSHSYHFRTCLTGTVASTGTLP